MGTTSQHFQIQSSGGNHTLTSFEITIMSFPADSPAPNPPIFQSDEDSIYTLEMTAQITGVSSTTILHYHEAGLISKLTSEATEPEFDDEALRRIRRIEHVREVYEAPTQTVKLILSLMDEVEELRRQLRLR